MKIRYTWRPKGDGPAEITSIELDTNRVPLIGELVEINVQIAQDEWCQKSGRVKDVIWTIALQPMASVILGA